MTDLRAVAVFGSSTIERDSAEWAQAERCGSLLAQASLAVASGGYGGVMEAVSHGAAAAGGRVIGVTAPTVFPHRTGPNEHVHEIIEAASITERIHLLVSVSAGVIVLPGSLGTFTELVAAWNAAYVAPLSDTAHRPIITVGDTWNSLIDTISVRLDADRSGIETAATVDAAVRRMVDLLGVG